MSLRPGRKRSIKAIAQEQDFKNKLHTLFDTSKPDAKEHLKDEDFLFLQDRRGPRKFSFGKKDMELERRLSRKRHTRKKHLIKENENVKKKKKEHWKQLVPLILVIVMLQVLFANLKMKSQGLVHPLKILHHSQRAKKNYFFTLSCCSCRHT